jgi:Protein-disulfide isomerase
MPNYVSNMQHRKWKLGTVFALILAAMPMLAQASQEPGQVPVPPTHHIIMPIVPPVQWDNTTSPMTIHTDSVVSHSSLNVHPLYPKQDFQPPELTLLTPHEQAIMQKVHGFVWGESSAPEKAIVFIDPNCILCHHFFEEVQAGVAQGKARYLIIPVAILKKSSVAKAERMLDAQHPQAAFLQDERHFNLANESGGLSGKPFPAPKTIQDILSINTSALTDLENNAPVTPTFVVKTSSGLELHAGGL